MAERAALVEGMLKRGETQGLDQAVAAMESELGRLLDGIGAAMGTAANPGVTTPTSINMEALGAELRRLGALLAEADADASAAAEGLTERLIALGQAKATKVLMEQVAEFEFDAARERVQEIARALEISL